MLLAKSAAWHVGWALQLAGMSAACAHIFCRAAAMQPGHEQPTGDCVVVTVLTGGCAQFMKRCILQPLTQQVSKMAT